MNPLAALAVRVEAAETPSRELDSEIAAVQGFCAVNEGHPLGWQCYDADGKIAVFRRYTASLDAAMTLIPAEADSAGETWRMEGYSDPGVLAPHVRASAWVAGAARVYAATPALALCAAALRARASIAGAGE